MLYEHSNLLYSYIGIKFNHSSCHCSMMPTRVTAIRNFSKWDGL